MLQSVCSCPSILTAPSIIEAQRVYKPSPRRRKAKLSLTDGDWGPQGIWVVGVFLSQGLTHVCLRASRAHGRRNASVGDWSSNDVQCWLLTLWYSSVRQASLQSLLLRLAHLNNLLTPRRETSRACPSIVLHLHWLKRTVSYEKLHSKLILLYLGWEKRTKRMFLNASLARLSLRSSFNVLFQFGRAGIIMHFHCAHQRILK